MLTKKEAEFLDLMDNHQRVVHSVCRTYTDNRTDHDDLFQEILTQLWQGYDRFQGNSKISTWIYRVSLYTAITYIKKVMKGREFQQTMKTNTHDLPKSEETDEELLMMAIKRLDESDRAIVLLYLDDKSYKEMAEILGLSESNVGVKLNRIKKKLKDLMTN